MKSLRIHLFLISIFCAVSGAYGAHVGTGKPKMTKEDAAKYLAAARDVLGYNADNFKPAPPTRNIMTEIQYGYSMIYGDTISRRVQTKYILSKQKISGLSVKTSAFVFTGATSDFKPFSAEDLIALKVAGAKKEDAAKDAVQKDLTLNDKENLSPKATVQVTLPHTGKSKEAPF